MNSVGELLSFIDDRVPLAAAADWDPVGLQVGDPSREVGSVGVCHEVTASVLDSLDGVSTLVAYHPLLFQPTQFLVAGSSATGRALRLAELGVALIVVHTAFDVTAGGTADGLADALELEEVEPFGEEAAEGIDGPAIGRIGWSRESLTGLSKLAAQRLQTSPRLAAAAAGKGAEGMRVAVVPGSGSSFVEEAARQGAGLLVTGDVSHHRAQRATELGLSVMDAGHIPTPGQVLGVEVEGVAEGGEGVD